MRKGCRCICKGGVQELSEAGLVKAERAGRLCVSATLWEAGVRKGQPVPDYAYPEAYICDGLK